MRMGKSKIQNLKSKIDKPSAMTPRVKVMTRIVLALIAAAVFAADQLTKHLVERRLPDGAVVRVIPGFFNLITTKNSGAVFGLFNDSTVWWKTPLLIAVSAVLLIVVVLRGGQNPAPALGLGHRTVPDSGRRALQSI